MDDGSLPLQVRDEAGGIISKTLLRFMTATDLRRFFLEFRTQVGYAQIHSPKDEHHRHESNKVWNTSVYFLPDIDGYQMAKHHQSCHHGYRADAKGKHQQHSIQRTHGRQCSSNGHVHQTAREEAI